MDQSATGGNGDLDDRPGERAHLPGGGRGEDAKGGGGGVRNWSGVVVRRGSPGGAPARLGRIPVHSHRERRCCCSSSTPVLDFLPPFAPVCPRCPRCPRCPQPKFRVARLKLLPARWSHGPDPPRSG